MTTNLIRAPDHDWHHAIASLAAHQRLAEWQHRRPNRMSPTSCSTSANT